MSDRGRIPWGRRVLLAAVLVLVSGTALIIGAGTGAADGPTTFSNTTAIVIPATGSPDQIGPASPYPSTVAVSGMAGVVTAVTVTFSNVTHSIFNDIDALLVAPDGNNLTVLSDAANSNTFTFATNANLTFSDSGTALPGSGAVASGTYLPTGPNGPDTFPAPAPTTSSAQTTFAGAFTGISPNGTWQLFVVDDTTGDVGTMAGGWSLSITTEVTSVATTTAATTSGSPSATGGSVTFTATVLAGVNPVTIGTVQFRDGATAIGAPVALSGAGTASVTTAALTEGTHSITATYGGATGFLTSNGSVTQQVDNQTTVTGTTYCNTGPITVPDSGPTTPYPSHITISGITDTPSAVSATLTGLSHSAPIDLDVLLAGPDPTDNVILLSDAGGQDAVSEVDLTFADSAAGPVSGGVTSGTFRPTNDDTDGADSFPAPAPSPSGATTMATFLTGSINGQWSLYVVDDATGDSGSISGGWCITAHVPAPTITAVTSSPNPSTDGSPMTVTATVTAAGSPVTAGTITFDDDGTSLGPPVAVAGDGTASFTSSVLAVGTHPLTATYSGTDDFAGSSGTTDQAVDPIVDAGGPYNAAEGGSLTLAGSGSSGVSVEWDLNDDGDFTDATGPTPSLTWDALQALGIDDGPGDYPITVRGTLNGRPAVDSTTLTVSNTAPTAVVTGDLTATAGQVFTVKVGADDPSAADMAAQFTYIVDWGDGSPVETVTGPADPPVSHTYATAGTVTASFTATDKDGGQGGPTAVDVVVAAAPPTTSTSQTTSTSPTPTTQSTTTVTTTSTAAGTGGTMAVIVVVRSTPTAPAPTPAYSSTAGSLSSTGVDVELPVLLGLCLLSVGGGLLAASRIRRRVR